MSRKYKIRNQIYPHFVSFSVVYWIDLFTRPVYREVIIESIEYCQENKGLIIYAWCIMTNHVNLMIGTRDKSMQDTLRDLKRFTSGKLKEVIENNPSESRKNWMLWMMRNSGKRNSNNNEWQLWQQNNNPIELSTNQMIDQRLEYLHQNPVKAGFVYKPEDWVYSSAMNYAGGKGLINVTLIE